jgi:hypothetical protein
MRRLAVVAKKGGTEQQDDGYTAYSGQGGERAHTFSKQYVVPSSRHRARGGPGDAARRVDRASSRRRWRHDGEKHRSLSRAIDVASYSARTILDLPIETVPPRWHNNSCHTPSACHMGEL